MSKNQWCLDKAIQITIAKMESSDVSANQIGGTHVADFLEKVYNKIVELEKKDPN